MVTVSMMQSVLKDPRKDVDLLGYCNGGIFLRIKTIKTCWSANVNYIFSVHVTFRHPCTTVRYDKIPLMC